MASWMISLKSSKLQISLVLLQLINNCCSNLSTAKDKVEAIGNGGLSGAPIRAKSTAVIKYLADKSNGAFPIIAVGGIDSAAAAIEKLEAGASLVQVYSALIYKGPTLVKEINKGLTEYYSK